MPPPYPVPRVDAAGEPHRQAEALEQTGGKRPLSSLVEGARNGDAEAFRRLARRVHRRVFRWALARTGDPDEAEDVAQEVLVRMHRAIGDFEGRSRFTTWLYRMTTNTAYTLARREGRRREIRRGLREARNRGDDPGGAPPPGDVASPAGRAAWAVGGTCEPRPLEELERRRLVGLVKAYFDELPPRQRQIFDLADLQGHGPTEIAEMLGMNPSTVRANLHKARRAIRVRILAEDPALENELREGSR